METILSIAHWNKKQFNPTLDKQRGKVKEEFEEYTASYSLEELADTLIAIIGLARFYKPWKGLIKCVFTLGLERFERQAILNAIQLKMEINRSRVWEGQHHIEQIQ